VNMQMIFSNFVNRKRKFQTAVCKSCLPVSAVSKFEPKAINECHQGIVMSVLIAYALDT
jgi:hypothetical protein